MRTSGFGLSAVAGVLLPLSAALAAPFQVGLHPGDVGLGINPNSFSADSLGVRDYAVVTLGATTGTNTAFSETGFINISNFSLNNTPVNPPGLDTGGTGSYSLFFAFTATGIQNQPTTSAAATGQFTSLHFDLLGANGLATFTYDPGTNSFLQSGTGATKTLASGDLLNPSTTFVTYFPTGGGQATTSAQNIITSYNVQPDGTGFLTPADIVLNLSSSFTNTAGVTQVVSPTSFTINGGGGNADFSAAPVPEPAAIGLFGAGLLAFGLVRQKRRR